MSSIFGFVPSLQLTLISPRWSLCTLLPSLACFPFPDPTLHRPQRNKAVLNSSPDLPLLFLFLQLIIAVFLLHVATAFSDRIEIPRWDWSTAKKLFPVVAINIIGLVFNTLCLREVEATFFQVRITVSDPHPLAQSQSSQDCKRLGPALNDCCYSHQVSPTTGDPCHSRSWYRHHRIFRWCHTRRQPPCLSYSITYKSTLRRIFLSFDCDSFGLGQVVSFLLQQLDHPTCILDECRFCDAACPICVASWRTCKGGGIEYDFGMECGRFYFGEPGDWHFRISALRGRITEHQSDESHHTHVFKCAFPSITLLVS